jgi:hypothetical protein
MSASQRFMSLPPQAFAAFGGYTWVKPDAWRRYMDMAIRSHFPGHLSHNTLKRRQPQNWHENDCIYTSLSKYLLTCFGFLIPEDNLFKFYNWQGEGISPERIIEAIQAVSEPFGFEVAKVLAPDAELRQGMGYPELALDLSHAAEFHGRPGLCMINVQEGYSHAFFWKIMDQVKFTKEQFRMAVLIESSTHDNPASPSALRCFDEFHRLLLSCLPAGRNASRLQAEIECLFGYIHLDNNRECPDFRSQVERRLATLLAQIKSELRIPGFRKNRAQTQLIEESGRLVARIFRECDDIL